MKTTLKIYNYRRGGSLVCDEERTEFNYVPSSSQIRQEVEQHKKKHNVKTVYFELWGCFK